jgi:hypothetical protein
MLPTTCNITTLCTLSAMVQVLTTLLLLTSTYTSVFFVYMLKPLIYPKDSFGVSLRSFGFQQT